MYDFADAVKTNPIKANTKPIQTQFAERPPDAQMNVNTITTKDYENETAFGLRQNKPNQTQFQRQKNAAACDD